MKKFEDKLIAEFQDFEHERFIVSFSPAKVFLCGGPVDVQAAIPLSARQRLIAYFSTHEVDLHDACIQAEDFKDYFREGAYSDLLEFERDIASIATMIVVCLESPGSLVELGLFCMDPINKGKLLVVAPQEKLAAEDSFIFLGPLENIRRKDEELVLAFPWPRADTADYDDITTMAGDIKRKFEKMPKTQKFSAENPAHIAFLIHDIVMLAHPITLSEIELAIMAFKLNVEARTVTRLLYLLEKTGLIAHDVYSSVKYYFAPSKSERRIMFGLDTKGKKKDTPALVMAFRQVYALGDDELSRKRRLALKQIQKLKAEMK